MTFTGLTHPTRPLSLHTLTGLHEMVEMHEDMQSCCEHQLHCTHTIRVTELPVELVLKCSRETDRES